MAEVTRLLGATRLLTLTGSGGAGKTRLALEVGISMNDVWLLDLAPMPDRGMAALLWQAVVGVWPAGAGPVGARAT